jgi:hypothetical protein
MQCNRNEEVFLLSRHADKVVFWSTIAMCAAYLLVTPLLATV